MPEGTESRVIDQLPDLDPILGILPARAVPYRVTLSDVHDLFVARAPFRERRELLFSALEIYASLIWSHVPKATLVIDGGFATHKRWEEPNDVDVLVLAEGVDLATKAMMAADGLFTMSDVSGKIREKELPEIPKLRPLGGLIDGYFGTSVTSAFLLRQWAQVRGPNGEIAPDVSKGLMEVSRGIE